MIDRRDWLARAAFTAAAIGLPKSWLEGFSAADDRPYLTTALECGKWIERARQYTEHGVRWPADPLKPDAVSPELYNGMSGVVVFLSELYHTTRDSRWLDSAKAGADYLIHEVETNGDKLDAGLYTGLAGIMFTVASVAKVGGGGRYDQAARKILGLIVARAKADGPEARWGGANDIISGSAGTGLALLDAHRRWGDESALGAAQACGRGLLAAGQSAQSGTMWFPSTELKRNYPNFSHGTSGVGYFLATLHQRTQEAAFLEGALAGVRYLDAIATRQGDATTIFHHEPGGTDLYYLSWCHGPVGTSRLFYRLHQITKDPKWMEWVNSLTRGVLASGIPEQRTPGFWQNISQCCGNVGVGQYFIDLERSLRDRTARGMIERVVKDTMARSTHDNDGSRWVQAENRTEPTNLVAQTGFMQGAAGVGTFLLRLDAASRGKGWALDFPDTPYLG